MHFGIVVPVQNCRRIFSFNPKAAQPRFWPVLVRVGVRVMGWVGLGLRPYLDPTRTMQYVNSLQDPCQHIVKGVDGRLSRRILLLLYYWYQCVLFWTCARFSPAPVGLFSRSQIRGAQGAPACTLGASLGPGRAPRCVLLGVQSREIWQVITGFAFRGARAEQDNGKPTFQPVLL